MKMGRSIIGITGIYLCVSVASTFGQTSNEEAQGPNRILQMLNETERNYIEGKANADELSEEDIEHVKRIQRLHQLETAKEVELEPAGAQVVQRQQLPQQQDYAIEDLEIQQQESTSVMMRDLARLRAEVLRLNARVQALEMELDGTVDSLEAEPQFYLPVR